MKVFIKRTTDEIVASGEYNEESNEITINKGSIVCRRFSENYYNEKFVKLREKIVDNTKLLEDITFKSPSTAACFVLGRSANGWVEWKDEKNICLKSYKKSCKK